MKRSVGPEERVVAQEAKTLSEVAYGRIRADILWGRAAPGSALKSNDLQATYGFGVSPLREALTRLVAEGLVTSSGQRGFRVAAISAEEVRDVLRSRLVVEAEALRSSIARGDDHWESDVVAAYHRLTKAEAPRGPGADAELWAARHRQFHASLIAASGSPILNGFAATLYDKAERYRLLDVRALAASDHGRDVPAEHERLMRATLARRADQAVEALRHHYQQTADDVVEALAAKAA